MNEIEIRELAMRGSLDESHIEGGVICGVATCGGTACGGGCSDGSWCGFGCK